MTLLATILLGTGILLVISAIEDTPLVQTFQDVLSGKLPQAPQTNVPTSAPGTQAMQRQTVSL